MNLQSKLLHGDPKLEAAAVSDPDHITTGSSGPHVRKIQAALVLIDAASIYDDEVRREFYGPSTANAVLRYKQKRNIVNLSYQTQADDIVGKMTIASFDSEMLRLEALPRKPVQIRPLGYSRVRPPRPPELAALIDNPQHLQLNFAISSSVLGGPRIVPGPSITTPSILPTTVLEMRRNSISSVEVIDGEFGDLVVQDPAIVKIAPDAPVVPSGRALVGTNPQTFKVFSGPTLGVTRLTVSTLQFADGGSASIDVVVKTFFDPPSFVQGVQHNHKPSGKWAQVQANPNSGFLEEIACRMFSPEGVVNRAKEFMFNDKPIALKHLDWYLKDGQGKDFVEDDNIREWLRRDQGIRNRLKREIFPRGQKPRAKGHFEFTQGEFAQNPDGRDFQFAFGSIDRVDFDVDFSQDTVRVFFKDRYEWHPVFSCCYDLQKGDVVRETNCVHAALVELKTSGAADFWMVGAGEVNLSLIAKP